MLQLVTGATGFIGRRLVGRLLLDGVTVRALVLPGEDTSTLGDVEVVTGDVRDAACVARATRGVDTVFHLAAVVGDWGDEHLFEQVNVEGTRHVLDAAAAHACRRVVMVSSIVVYGSRLRTGLCEEGAPREYGVSPYSRTKRASEVLALDYDALGRCPVTVVRPGNVFGAGPGVWVDGLAEVLRSGRGLLIDGGNGDATLAHVDNVVEVLVRAARRDGAAGRIYNANDGCGITWRQYMGDLADAVGAERPHRSVPLRMAMAAAAAMERGSRAIGRAERPLLTREAVTLLSSKRPVPVERAERELGYSPVITYGDAMESIVEYVHGGVA